MIVVDNKMIREPNLLTPKKKPVGNVEVDWNHPLSDGLGFITLNRGIYDGSVDNNSSVIAVGGTPEQERGGITFNSASNEYIEFEDANITQGYPITFMFVEYCPATPVNCIGISWANGNVASTYFVLGTDTNGNATYQHRAGSNTASVFYTYGGVVKNNAINVVVAVSAASNDHKLYMNGEQVASNTNLQNTFGNALTRLATGALLDSSPGYNDGTVHCSMLFHKALSAEEIRALSADPYQILKPA